MKKEWIGRASRRVDSVCEREGSGMKKGRVRRGACGLAVGSLLAVAAAEAHHSFAMYDTGKTYVLTGIVTRVDPNPNHLQIFFAPLNEARDQVVKDDKGEPIVWAVEMDGAGNSARQGISVNGFPRNTIISIGLHPLRNGFPGGGRGQSGLFKCPADTPPAPGKHCDSVPGSTSHGEGVLPTPTGPAPAKPAG
jgi:hypothetical protein